MGLMTIDEIAAIRSFVNLILHGNAEHRAWLKEAAELFIEGEHVPLPPEPPQNTNAVFVEIARSQLRQEKFAQLQKLVRLRVQRSES